LILKTPIFAGNLNEDIFNLIEIAWKGKTGLEMNDRYVFRQMELEVDKMKV